MRAAICCSGQSLVRTYPGQEGRYDEVWAVNTALKIVSADWLSAGDVPIFRGIIGDYRPRRGTITFQECINEFRGDSSWSGLEWTAWQGHPVIGKHQRAGRPINWSMQAAMCHAAARGAKRIDLYGADLAGTVDCSGHVGPDRNAERWARETEDLAFTVRFLVDEYGIATVRITDEAPIVSNLALSTPRKTA